MFPLGTVLVPGMLLPLQVFEPRYRRMLDDCLSGDRSFGVVLIERGSEVGGGDARVDVGTLARIVQADELPDGRWALIAVGVQRIRVDGWLPDDPYPCAETTAWPDEPGAGDDRGDVLSLLRRSAALSAELGIATPPLDLDLADDPVIASYQATVASPFGPADRQRLLASPTVPDRWALLDLLLADHVEVLEARIAHGM